MKDSSKLLAAARRCALLVSVLGVVAVASAPLCAQDPDVNVLTWGYDPFKTQQKLNEATLTKTALQSTTNKFGQLCNISVDGQVYAQPLVVTDVKFNGVTTPYTSVVYVVTQNDTVYAINGTAQGTSPTTCNATTTNQILGSQPLLTYNINGTNTTQWPVSCYFVGAGDCGAIKPYVGILGTPVIALSGVGAGTMYLVAETQDTQPCTPPCTGPSNWYHWLHALDITTLAEKTGYPIRVYPPPPYQNSATFFSENHIQRPGLLYVSPNVYIAFSMMDGIKTPLPEGWILGYNTTTPSTAPNYFSTTAGAAGSAGGGIWQGGAGLAYGLNKGGTGGKNLIYFNTGNGDFVQSGTQLNVCTSCGDSFIELDPSTSPMTVSDFFTPNDQAYRNCLPPPQSNYTDMDFGSGGVMLFPQNDLVSWPWLAVSGDKEGGLYFMNLANAGEYKTPNNCSTTCPTACSQTDEVADNVQNYWIGSATSGPVIHTNPAYWASGAEGTTEISYLFVAPAQWALTRYTLCNGTGATVPISTTCGAAIPATDSTGTAVHFKNGATPVISANGLYASDAVVWGIWQDGAAEDAMTLGPPPTTGILYAFDAGTTGTSMPALYTSNNTCALDEMAPGTKFSVPTVANGYVYVGGQSPNTAQNNTGLGTVYIFGLGRTGATGC